MRFMEVPLFIVIHQLSKTGTYHLDAHEENQDALCYGCNRSFSVISLADGVSTCKEAKRGAEIASRAITDLLLQKGDHLFGFENQQIADFALSHVLYELKQKASEDRENLAEYSSTIASVFWDKRHGKLLCFNLGDSLIMATGKSGCRVLAMPSDSSSGCCVTTTKNALLMATVRVIDTSQIESVIICSDGAWKPMFTKNKLRPEVAALLIRQEFEELKAFLNKQDCFDDYSFISMDIQRECRRKSA